MKRATFRRLVSVALVVLLVAGIGLTAYAAEGDPDTMKLSDPDSSGNTAFAVENMFPGDGHTKDFTVKVSHKEPITLYYHADIRPGSEKLAEVMMVEISLPEKNITLYDGLMRDMPSALEHVLAADEQQIVYRITAYLETSVGNPYQYQSLVADFRWWYMEESVDPEPVSVKLVAEKTMDGQYPRGSAFTFVLKDREGNVLQKVNNRDGIVEFDTLTFDQEGTYYYTLTEQAGSDSGIVYDPAVYMAIVSVKKVEDAFEATVTYEKNGEAYQVLPRFANVTKGETPPPEDPEPPKTGDNSHLAFYGAVCMTSALGLLLLLFATRQKKEEAA